VLDLKKELSLRTLLPNGSVCMHAKTVGTKKIAKASMQKEEVILCTNAKALMQKEEVTLAQMQKALMQKRGG
jgi:hypothetical protein